jgi:hypothetical protein
MSSACVMVANYIYIYIYIYNTNTHSGTYANKEDDGVTRQLEYERHFDS